MNRLPPKGLLRRPLPVALLLTAWLATGLQAAPALVLAKPSLPQKVSVGQGFQVELPMTNRSKRQVMLEGVSVSFSGKGLEPTLLSKMPLEIAARASRVVTFAVAVAGTAASGSRRLAVSARWIETGKAKLVARPLLDEDSILVQQEPDLALVELRSSQPSVAAGQPFVIGVVIGNRGEADAKLTGASLTFGHGALETAPLMPNLTIPGGQRRRFSFAIPGADSVGTTRIVSAAIIAVDANSGKPIGLKANLVRPLVVETQNPPAVEVVSIRVSRTTVSAGQSLLATVAVRNSGGSTVDIREESLRFDRPLLSAASMPLACSLTGGGSTTSFTFTVEAGKFAGVCRIVGAGFVAADRNKGTPVVIGLGSGLKRPAVRVVLRK